MYFDITESFSYVREIANPDALLWTTRFITLTRMPRYWSALMSPTLVTILTGGLSLPDTSLMECPSMASPMSRYRKQVTCCYSENTFWRQFQPLLHCFQSALVHFSLHVVSLLLILCYGRQHWSVFTREILVSLDYLWWVKINVV